VTSPTLRALTCVVTAVLVSAAIASAAEQPSPYLPVEFSGTVYLPDARPAANVKLLPVGVTAWYGFPTPPGSVGGDAFGGAAMDPLTTDTRGRYRWTIRPEPPGGDATTPAPRDARIAWLALLYSPDGAGYAYVSDLSSAQTHVDIHLRAGDRVEGRVLGYPGAQPMAGVEVSVGVAPPIFMGHGGGPVAERVVTDGDGRFRMKASFPPDSYTLHASLPKEWGEMEVRLDPPASETPTSRSAEISLAHTYTVRGHAYGPDGQPLRKTRLSFGTYGFPAHLPGVIGRGFGGLDEATTDDTGAYSLPQPPRVRSFGTWTDVPRFLVLTAGPQGSAIAPAALIDATDPATFTADFRFGPPGTVTGKQMAGATGRPGWGVWAHLAPASASPALARLDLRNGAFDKEHSVVKNDATGEFALRGVPPGKYRLEFDGLTIRPRTAASGQALPVTVKAGETVDVGTVQVHYVPHFRGLISGLPGKLNDYEFLGVLRPSGTADPGREAYVDLWEGGGKYSIWAYDRPAGKYDAAVMAWKGGQPAYVAPVLHGIVLPDETAVEGKNLPFTTGASLSGKVVRADGKPLPKTAVALRGAGGDAAMLDANGFGGFGYQGYIQLETNDKGEFSVQGLLPGEYRVTAGVEALLYGPQPTLRVRLAADEHKAGLLLRTQRNG